MQVPPARRGTITPRGRASPPLRSQASSLTCRPSPIHLQLAAGSGAITPLDTLLPSTSQQGLDNNMQSPAASGGLTTSCQSTATPLLQGVCGSMQLPPQSGQMSPQIQTSLRWPTTTMSSMSLPVGTYTAEPFVTAGLSLADGRSMPVSVLVAPATVQERGRPRSPVNNMQSPITTARCAPAPRSLQAQPLNQTVPSLRSTVASATAVALAQQHHMQQHQQSHLRGIPAQAFQGPQHFRSGAYAGRGRQAIL